MCDNENRVYRDYLYMQDPTLTLDGCCQSYPLDRDYWNNQILDRNFLIDYPTIEHIKYPISEGLCTGDSSVIRGCSPGTSTSKGPNPVWTIEEEGLLDGVSCQGQRMAQQRAYWLQNDSQCPMPCPSQGMPLLNTHIGQRLIDPCTKALDVNHALEELEKKRLETQCCPSIVDRRLIDRKQINIDRWTPRSRMALQMPSNTRKAKDVEQDYQVNLDYPWITGNRRNVDAESALMGINYLNNRDCYQNRICSDPLQAAKSNLYKEFFQDTNYIYPNYTPKFWDNLTKARSGAQLVTSKCPF